MSSNGSSAVPGVGFQHEERAGLKSTCTSHPKNVLPEVLSESGRQERSGGLLQERSGGLLPSPSLSKITACMEPSSHILFAAGIGPRPSRRPPR